MKLIDILVDAGDTIPLLGVHTKYLAMDPDGRVHGYCDMPSPTVLGWGIPDALYSTDGRGCLIQLDRDDVDGQWQSAIITREQYESALAAKNDGWIDWGGGECPVPEGALVDVRYRNSEKFPDTFGTIALAVGGYGATGRHWNHDGYPNDIIAYRLHKPQEAEKTVNHFEGAPEWAMLRVKHKTDGDEYFITSMDEMKYQSIGATIGRPVKFSHQHWDVIATREPQDANSRANDELLEADLNECIGHGAAPVWNGEGLPPVGCRIEYTCKQTDAGHPAIEAGKWYGGAIIAYYGGGVWTSDNGIRHLSNTIFRPIRSEEYNKRYAAIEALFEILDAGASASQDSIDIYYAIAEGKIPGVKLGD